MLARNTGSFGRGAVLARKSRFLKQELGTSVIWQGKTYQVTQKAEGLREHYELLSGLGVNASESDLSVFCFSPADMPTVLAAGQNPRPLPGDIIIWQGVSFTVYMAPPASQVAGVSVELMVNAYRTPQPDTATTEQAGEPTPGVRVQFNPPDATT